MTNTLNRQLAALLGWTNIVDNGGALLGRPPEGAPNSRDQARVPDWEGDWSACGPLIGTYHVGIDSSAVFYVEAHCPRMPWVEVSVEDISYDEATRRAIVRAVIAKLEAGQ